MNDTSTYIHNVNTLVCLSARLFFFLLFFLFSTNSFLSLLLSYSPFPFPSLSLSLSLSLPSLPIPIHIPTHNIMAQLQTQTQQDLAAAKTSKYDHLLLSPFLTTTLSHPHPQTRQQPPMAKNKHKFMSIQ